MRRIAIGIAAALFAAAIGIAVAWHLSARALAEGVARWAAERRAEGYAVSYETSGVGGFPFALTLRLDRPVVEAPGGLWRWEGPAVEGRAWLWSPLAMRVSAPGRHLLRTHRDGRDRIFDLDAREARGIVEIDRAGRFERGELHLAELLAAEEGGPQVAVGAADLRAHAAAPAVGLPVLAFALSAVEVSLPAEPRPALGRAVPLIEAEGEIRGPLPAGRAQAALTRWRDAGGVLDLARFRARWGPLDLDGDGTFALDEAMRPLGAATVALRGLSATLGRLVEAGVVPPREGGLAQALVAALARPPEGGGPPEVRVAVTLQDGYLFLGPVRLLALRPVILE